MANFSATLARCACGAAMASASLPAAAQERPKSTSATPDDQATADSTANSDDIVVTALKRSTTLQDVPLSVTALRGDQITSSIADTARSVPGLMVQDLGPGLTQVTIRGVSSGPPLRDEVARKETVGVYLDDSPIALALYTPDLEPADFSRIEILRGPQGTLFGAGSEGGTLRYITNAPNLSKVEGYGEASIGVTDGASKGDVSYGVAGALNLPLVEDAVGLRVTAYHRRFPGFIDALGPNNTLRTNVNSGERSGGRVAVALKPTSNLTITPRYVYQQLVTNGFPRVDALNFFANPYTSTRPPVTLRNDQQYRQTGEGIVDNFRLADLNIDWDLGGVRLSSTSSYIYRDIVYAQDSSTLSGYVNAVLIGVPSIADMSSTLRTTTNLKSYTQEVRLASDGNGPLTWLIGGYYSYQKKIVGQQLAEPGFDAAFNATTGAGYVPLTPDLKDTLVKVTLDMRTEQAAAFGEATYKLTDRLSATLGVRYYSFVEKRTTDSRPAFYGASPSPPARIKDSGVTPRAILAYKVTPTVQLTAQAGKGFRLGGINDPLSPLLCASEITQLGGNNLARFETESVWNYEVGLKSQFANKRITFNASAFNEDIDNLQVSVRFPCSATLVFNAPKARARGVEMEFAAKATDALELNASFSYTDAKVLRAVPLVDIRAGDRLPTTPRYRASGSMTYTMPVGPGWSAFVRADLQYQSDSFTYLLDQRNGYTYPVTITYGRPAGSPTTVNKSTLLAGFALLNLRIGAQSSDGWSFELQGTNVTNRKADLAINFETGGAGRFSYIRNQPRTVTLTARKNF